MKNLKSAAWHQETEALRWRFRQELEPVESWTQQQSWKQSLKPWENTASEGNRQNYLKRQRGKPEKHLSSYKEDKVQDYEEKKESVDKIQEDSEKDNEARVWSLSSRNWSLGMEDPGLWSWSYRNLSWWRAGSSSVSGSRAWNLERTQHQKDNRQNDLKRKREKPEEKHVSSYKEDKVKD